MIHEVPSKVLICTGFHRSATSATANYLFNAGLDMGRHLVPSHISNRAGHFEDSTVVSIHDDWLLQNETDWEYHNEVSLCVGEGQLEQLKQYVLTRDSSASKWGVKDPRFCLFLNEWNQVLGERAHFLFVLRHWSASIESLFNRHSRELAYNLNLKTENPHFRFWSDPTLAARMWLAYCSRVLQFAKNNPNKSLIVTQRSLFEGVPLILELNNKFDLDLFEEAEKPFKKDWLNDNASSRIRQLIPETLVKELNRVWLALIDLTTFKSNDESPSWIEGDYNCSITSYFSEVTLSERNEPFVKMEAAESFTISETELTNVLKESDTKDFSRIFDSDLFSQNEYNADTFFSVYKWCLKNHPTDQQAQIPLAFWLQRNKQFELAIEVWQRSLSLKVIAPYMYFQLALCYESLNDKRSALYYSEIACEKNPSHPGFWVLQGKLLMSLNSLDEAKKTFERAIQLAPDKPSVVLPYCDFLANIGDYNMALTKIDDLLKHDNSKKTKQLKLQLLYKVDSEMAEEMYYEQVVERLSQLSTEQRKLALSSYLLATGSHEAEYDLFYRMLDHWKKLEGKIC